MFAAFNSNAQVLIRGKITDNDGKTPLSYFTPFNNFFNNMLINEHVVEIDEKKHFSIFEPINSSGILILKFGNFPIYIAAAEKDTIDITVKIINEDIKLSFLGSNAKGHELLNEIYENPMTKLNGILNTLDNIKNINKEHVIDSVKKNIEIFANRFSVLLKENEITHNYYQLAVTSIKSILISEFLKPFIRKSNIVKQFTPPEIRQLEAEVFTYLNPLDTLCGKGILAYYYTDDYYRIKYYQEKKITSLNQIPKDSLLQLERKRVVNISNDFIPYLYIQNKYFKENLWGIQLYYLKKIFPLEITNDEYEAFRYYFPNSSFLAYLKPLFTEEKDKKSINISNSYKIDKIGKYTSLKQLVSNKFKNKAIFIDLWASWCIPCKQEFEYNKIVDSFLTKKNIKKVYISIDDISKKRTWLKNIEYFKLTGYHFIANKELINDIKSHVYKKGELFSIPRYLIINAKGQIIDFNAPRPSNYNQLFTELSKL